MLLFSSATGAAQKTSAPTPDIAATYPVTLHERLNPSCELIQPVTLMQYKQYDALALAGSTDEIYSPELHKGDFVALSTTVPKEVAKSAKKSGFEVHVESTEVSRLNGQPMTNGSSCPDSQQATLDAKDRRNQRRVDLQRRPHELGPDVLPPTIIQSVQPESVANQKAPQSGGQPKVKFEGTVVLSAVVGIDGEVQNVRVLQSLNGQLDKKAVEAVQQWKYSPARIKGLPVPAEIAVEVAFHLY
jgi:TonB family protein